MAEGSKYGIPFAMHLQSTSGSLGAKLPGFLRGCVAAIAWFGLQTFTGSLALFNYSREILAELFRNWWVIPVFWSQAT